LVQPGVGDAPADTCHDPLPHGPPFNPEKISVAFDQIALKFGARGDRSLEADREGAAHEPYLSAVTLTTSTYTR
jgi:hypothetical protein